MYNLNNITYIICRETSHSLSAAHLKQHGPPAKWSLKYWSASSLAPGCSGAPLAWLSAFLSHPAALPSQRLCPALTVLVLSFFYLFSHQPSLSYFCGPGFTWTSSVARSSQRVRGRRGLRQQEQFSFLSPVRR